jgi:WD40 repeat protein
VSDRWARVGLERLVWAGPPRRIDKDALNGFLAEFPNGAHAGEAARMRVQTRLIRVFAGHSDRVNSVAFSPDGCSALFGSSDDTLKLWDVATGNEIRTLAGHTNTVLSVAFSPDGKTALSGSADNTLKLWDVT